MLVILNAGPSRKLSQTILYLNMKINPFSLLWRLLYMFFRSRVDASHARVIGHAVYRQHVGRGPCINVVRIGITTQIVELATILPRSLSLTTSSRQKYPIRSWDPLET